MTTSVLALSMVETFTILQLKKFAEVVYAVSPRLSAVSPKDNLLGKCIFLTSKNKMFM